MDIIIALRNKKNLTRIFSADFEKVRLFVLLILHFNIYVVKYIYFRKRHLKCGPFDKNVVILETFFW